MIFSIYWSSAALKLLICFNNRVKSCEDYYALYEENNIQWLRIMIELFHSILRICKFYKHIPNFQTFALFKWSLVFKCTNNDEHIFTFN